jgi:ubiquinone/menaquinone biosynthesis C-methylase UbiE
MSQKGHPFPASGAFLLNNPIRRKIQPPSELVSKINIKPEDTVVDYGCGPAYYTLEIAKRAKTVFAVDISPDMLKKAKKAADKAGTQNIEFVLTDGKTLQLRDASVDIILLVTVYHEIGESETILKEFSRALKENGKLIIVEVVKKGIFPGAPVQNPTKLKAEIQANSFTFEKILPYRSYGMLFFTKKS